MLSPSGLGGLVLPKSKIASFSSTVDGFILILEMILRNKY